jgi:hypothetical protein
VLVVLVLVGSLVAGPPPHRAQPAPRELEHLRTRLLYLERGCYPLDYRHVICPDPAPK